MYIKLKKMENIDNHHYAKQYRSRLIMLIFHNKLYCMN